jgi:hypothetical protein
MFVSQNSTAMEFLACPLDLALRSEIQTFGKHHTLAVSRLLVSIA